MAWTTQSAWRSSPRNADIPLLDHHEPAVDAVIVLEVEAYGAGGVLQQGFVAAAAERVEEARRGIRHQPPLDEFRH